MILGLRPANDRRRYFVTTSLIGWAQAYNQPWYNIGLHVWAEAVWLFHSKYHVIQRVKLCVRMCIIVLVIGDFLEWERSSIIFDPTSTAFGSNAWWLLLRLQSTLYLPRYCNSFQRSITIRRHIQVPDVQMVWSGWAKWFGTDLVVPLMAAGEYAPWQWIWCW